MADENTRLNLFQKLAKIRALSDVASKSKRGYNYSYVDVTEILANVTAGMKKYGVSLIPSIVPETGKVVQNVVTNTKVDKQGRPYSQTVTEMLFSADMVFTWVNDENPNEKIDVPWFTSGSMSDPAQAIGSGMTYTLRRFLTSYFQIAEADYDVDAYRSKQKQAEVAEDEAIAHGLITEFDTALNAYLEAHKDEMDNVKRFVSKYVKNANYKNIKDPATAAKLLEDFKNNYMKEN